MEKSKCTSIQFIKENGDIKDDDCLCLRHSMSFEKSTKKILRKRETISKKQGFGQA